MRVTDAVEIEVVRDEVSWLPEPHPEELWSPIISVDDHVLEPPDLFTSRVPAALVDAVPRIELDPDGRPHWLIDDRLQPILTQNGTVGRPFSDWSIAAERYELFRDGVYQGEARLRDMDLDGVWASVCFPSTVFGFAGRVFSQMADPVVGLAALRAYNDWVIDEWCAVDPRRFIPCQVSWFRDPDIAAAEVRANAARGFRAVSFAESPDGFGFPGIHSGHWDPFFRACEETETVVNLHVGASGLRYRPSQDSPRAVKVALFPVSGVMSLIDWIFAGIPLRFPRIRVALSEGGASWVPMAYERLERAFRQREVTRDWSTDLHPVDVARRNFWYCSIEDPSAFRELDVIGRDRVMVETDYPHADSSWPKTQSMIRGQTTVLEPAVRRMVCFENAAALYRHELPPNDMIARAVGLRDAAGVDA